MSLTNWRTINVDALDPDSSANFDLHTLTPSVVPVSAADVQSTVAQIRQLLRAGDSEGALRGALDTAPYGADDRAKVRAVRLLPLLFHFSWISNASRPLSRKSKKQKTCLLRRCRLSLSLSTKRLRRGEGDSRDTGYPHSTSGSCGKKNGNGVVVCADSQ
jgi:hypothetical protein